MATAKPTKAKAAPAKKVASKTTAVKKQTEPKKTPAKTSSKSRSIGAEERYKMIEVAAYYIAERNGFKGSSIEYWIAAEAEITEKIAKK